MMNTEELESYMIEYMTKEQLQKAYKNIIQIKNMCLDYSLKKNLKIPSLIWKTPQVSDSSIIDYYCQKIPYLKTFLNSNFDGDKIMAKLIIDKLLSDERLRNNESYNELNNNLETTWISSEVNKAHWSAYFLNLQKTLDVCWDAGTIVGPGRGSGVGLTI